MTSKKTPAKKPAAKKTAKKTAKKSGKTPAKQTAIPGTRVKRDRKLEELAEDYEEARDERLAWQRTELEAKAKLTEYMEGKKVKIYTDGAGLEVLLEAKDATPNVKVRRKDNAGEAAA